MPTEEQELVARARAGDDDAFDALVALHHERVYRAAYAVAGPADADEVVQETWVRAWRGLARFRGDAGLGTWLTRLAVNAATDAHRRRRARATLTAALGRLLPLFAPAPTAAVEDRDELRRGLDSLDPDARRLLGLRFGLEYSVAEIAVVLGCPEGTVKSRLHAATAALRRAVGAARGDATVRAVEGDARP
jgi:RNA polymerase sigma-70 factor (ECF subfamily)